MCDLFHDAVSSLACSVQTISLLTQNVINTTALATLSKKLFFTSTCFRIPVTAQGYHSCFLCVLCVPYKVSSRWSSLSSEDRKPYNGTFSITYPAPRNRYLQWIFLYTFHFAFPVAKTHLGEK